MALSVGTRFGLLVLAWLTLTVLFVPTTTASSFTNREKEVVGHREGKGVNVAFLFAGTPRSFVVSMVHESIRTNLIYTLCPPPLCHAHIYARISRADNTHVPNDAVGIRSFEADKTTADLVDSTVAYALNRLKTQADSALYTQYVDAGSAEEMKEMEDHARSLGRGDKTLQHDIFRKLDPRRYSMHFNRDRVYRFMQSKEMEATGGAGYDWVVHARMDTAWSEPINQPVFSFDSNHIYVPSMWYADVPDTFALAPRHLADSYFDVNLLIAPGVMCLGGPNFNPETAEPESLQRMGFSTPEQAKAVKDALCLTMFHEKTKSGFSLVHEKKTNTTWTTAGFSEYILKRKLARAGLDTYRGTDSGHNLETKSYTVFCTFSLFITRYAPGEGVNAAPHYRYLTPGASGSSIADTKAAKASSVSLVCMYLRKIQYIPFAKTVGPTTGAAYSSCLYMNHLFPSHVGQSPWSLPCSVVVGLRGQQQSSSSSTIPSTQERDHECNPLDGTSFTALDHAITDTNFMPFRLRFRANKCVTAGELLTLDAAMKDKESTDAGVAGLFTDVHQAAKALNLNLQQDALKSDKAGNFPNEKNLQQLYRMSKPGIATCINYYRVDELMSQYHSTQLLSFLPLLGSTAVPQQIMVMDLHDKYPLCLSLPYDKASARIAASQGMDWTGAGVGADTEEAGTTEERKKKRKKGRGKRGGAEVELYLLPCAPMDWQRLHSRPSTEVRAAIKGAAHQLFIVDMVESSSSTARRQAQQQRMRRAPAAGGDAGVGAGEAPTLDALTVSMLRWSPGAIVAMETGDETAVMPTTHGSSLDEHLEDSGDLCVTATGTATGSATGSATEERQTHAGLVLRTCPVAVSVDKDYGRGTTAYSMAEALSTGPDGKARALPPWLAENVTSVLDYYHRSSVVEDPFSAHYDFAHANAGLTYERDSDSARSGSGGARKRGRRGQDKDPMDPEAGAERRKLMKKRPGGGGGGAGGGGRRRGRAGHHNHKLGGLNRFMFVVERTRTQKAPHAPGLIIGETPHW